MIGGAAEQAERSRCMIGGAAEQAERSRCGIGSRSRTGPHDWFGLYG